MGFIRSYRNRRLATSSKNLLEVDAVAVQVVEAAGSEPILSESYGRNLIGYATLLMGTREFENVRNYSA